MYYFLTFLRSYVLTFFVSYVLTFLRSCVFAFLRSYVLTVWVLTFLRSCVLTFRGRGLGQIGQGAREATKHTGGFSLVLLQKQP